MQKSQFIEISPGVSLQMLSIPGGTFLMGSPEDELGQDSDEGPQHQVTVPAFWMGKYPVTQAQWRAVAGLPLFGQELDPDPSYFKGDHRPVDSISFDDAGEFCARLSRLTGQKYRPPSEAEWEYACRAGTTTSFHFGKTITTDVANYGDRKGLYRRETTDVGSFPPNDFGLHDMHGNVCEWCLDSYHDSYNGAPDDGGPWAGSDQLVLRGGCWFLRSGGCRSAQRHFAPFEARLSWNGLRVVCNA